MISTRTTRRGAKSLAAVVGVSVLALAACSPSEEESPTETGTASETTRTTSEEFTYLGQTQNTTIVGTLEVLAADKCADINAGTPLTPDAVDGTTWDQQLQLLAGQDALSNMSMAAGTPSLMQEFIAAGKVVNLSEELAKLGVEDNILPAASATLKSLYNSDDLYALPTEYNIEGFWYNKELFAQAGITSEPTTWTELVAAAEALDAAGIQAFSAAGSDGWPVSRLVGNYIFRTVGPDALQKVADGEAKLTDPEYVAGAEAVAALGEAGYFGKAVGSVDYVTAQNAFLVGDAAMFYMGSWALGAFNSDDNLIGVDNIGYIPFPNVEGGAGSSADTPANAGIPVMFTTAEYTDDIADWLGCIAENYGDVALAEFGQVTGFTVSEPPANQSALTTLVQDQIASATGSVLWFEAKFSPEGTTVSQSNAGGLLTGAVEPAEFMALVQAANEG